MQATIQLSDRLLEERELVIYPRRFTEGVIRRLIINVPPRSGKSLLVSVVWPVWQMARNPHTRIIACSYGAALSSQHAAARRTLLEHPEVLKRWPKVAPRRDQRAKMELHNDYGGTIITTSVDGPITGKGGTCLIADDMQNPAEAASDAQREHALTFFRESLLSRLDNKGEATIVVVMQRLHMADLTALCLELGFVHVCLPAYTTERREMRFPKSGKVYIWEAEMPLWPAHEDREVLAQVERELGSDAFAAQYLQTPMPPGGGLFKMDQWQFYDQVPPEGSRPDVQAWDLALKGTATSDCVGAVVARIVGAAIHILEIVEQRMAFPETLNRILAMKARYPSSIVLIEDAANGPPAISELQRRISPVLAVPAQGGKEARAQAAAVSLGAGNLFLPRYRDLSGTIIPGREWVPEFITTCGQFPKGKRDDVVDALSHLVLWVWANPAVVPCGEFSTPPPTIGDLQRMKMPEHLRRYFDENHERKRRRLYSMQDR